MILNIAIMKKALFLLSLSILFSTCNPDKNVYVCTGSSSVAYHKTKTCKGLRNCGSEIKSITPKEAKEMNRRPCKICY